MKVLIIPSWYPYPQKPNSGRFFLDQAIALSKNSNYEYAILNWGQYEFQLQIRHPFVAIAKIFNYLTAKTGTRNIAPNLKEIKIPHLTWTSRLFYGNIRALVKKLRSLPKPDIIHSYVTFPAGFLAFRLAEKWKIPYIISEHSGPFPFPEYISGNKVSSKITLPLLNASAVLAVSRFLQSQILSSCFVQSIVIPNLVDTEFYQPASFAEPRKRFSFFSLSILTYTKGVMDLVEAFGIAVQKGLNADLFIGGDGYLKHKIKHKIITSHLEHRIHLLGFLNPQQALEQYQKCDCYILPSHIESFSLVLLEAMACGKPTLATDCGGPKDIVTPETGVLIPPQNPVLMAEAMLKMKENMPNYSAERIREICIKNYSPAVICNKITAVYQNILQK